MGIPVRFVLIALIALGAFTIPAESAEAQRRVALVIGNSAYVNTPRLENPKNDAADLAATLQQLGFEVIQGQDLDKAAMDRTIRTFAENLAGAQMALFFYAGHGLQVSGQNYLVPVDAKLSTASALDFEMVRLDLIQRTMERESTTNIIMLDACRDNPLARNLARSLGTRSASIGRGLAAIESGEGTLISYSTQPGNVALDGTGKNSPYAGALLKRMTVAGDDLPSILINVRNDVIAATSRRQVPWEHSALTAKVYFSPPQDDAKAREIAHNQQVELTYWSSVKDSASPTVLRTYLDRYPDGEFAPIARALIEQYEQAVKADLAARDEETKRREQQAKEAELKRLEEERRTKEIALAEERFRAEQAKNALETKRIEEQERTQHAASAEELRKALDDVRIAREAAKAAEDQRLAAVKAADEATKAASQTIARKRETTEAEGGKNRDAEAKVAALPKNEEPGASRFDGIWKFTRSSSEKCPESHSVFRVRIERGIVTGPTGRKGTISPSGKITVPGKGNDFTGTLRGNSGSGTFSGLCTGTFTAARN